MTTGHQEVMILFNSPTKEKRNCIASCKRNLYVSDWIFLAVISTRKVLTKES